MIEAIIGFLIGGFFALCVCATSSGKLRDSALTSATTSGYLVHNSKAYRVTLVEQKQGDE